MKKFAAMMTVVLGLSGSSALVLSLFGGAASIASAATTTCSRTGKMEFQTTFNSVSALDQWSIELGSKVHPDQLQQYTRGALSIQKGALAITARRNGHSYTSGRISTDNGCSFEYGRVEARIKTAPGAVLLSAFWLVDKGDHNEIDVTEQIGRQPHWSQDSVYSPKMRRNIGVKGRFVGVWHTYGVIWSPRWITFTLDNRRVARVKNTIHTKLYPVLNLAVGTPFAGKVGSKTHFPSVMRVQWVRVYRLGH